MEKDSREQILEVSLMLFLQKSFKAVTMKEIVVKTGLSKGAFYHYFDSKEKVFEEVVNHFYKELFVQDFDSFSHESLRSFYEDYLNDISEKFQKVQRIGLSISAKEQWNFNHYFLIFDAITILPSFKKLNEEHVLQQIKSWKKIIRIARKKGEIKAKLADEDVAKMFVYLGDGFGVQEILKARISDGVQFQKDVRKLWDGFYSLLKA